MSVCFYTPLSNTVHEDASVFSFNSVVPEVNFSNLIAHSFIKMLGLPYNPDEGLCGKYATEDLWSILRVCDTMLGSVWELLDRLKAVNPNTWQEYKVPDLNRSLLSLREVIEFARVSGQPLIWN